MTSDATEPLVNKEGIEGKEGKGGEERLANVKTTAEAKVEENVTAEIVLEVLGKEAEEALKLQQEREPAQKGQMTVEGVSERTSVFDLCCGMPRISVVDRREGGRARAKFPEKGGGCCFRFRMKLFLARPSVKRKIQKKKEEDARAKEKEQEEADKRKRDAIEKERMQDREKRAKQKQEAAHKAKISLFY